MGACTCGYSTDPEKNCNGTHNVVKAVKADMIAKLEAEGFVEAADHLKNNKQPALSKFLTSSLFNSEQLVGTVLP